MHIHVHVTNFDRNYRIQIMVYMNMYAIVERLQFGYLDKRKFKEQNLDISGHNECLALMRKQITYMYVSHKFQ